MTREEQIVNYMKKLDLSREQAEELYNADLNDDIGEEGEELTRKAKEMGRHYEQKGERKKTTRERKVDIDKVEIMQTIQSALEKFVKNLQEKTESECSFTYKDCEYSLKIIKHRPKK